MLVKPDPGPLPEAARFLIDPKPKSEPMPHALTRSVELENSAYTRQIVRGPPGGGGPLPPGNSGNTDTPVSVALALADMISAMSVPAPMMIFEYFIWFSQRQR